MFSCQTDIETKSQAAEQIAFEPCKNMLNGEHRAEEFVDHAGAACNASPNFRHGNRGARYPIAKPAVPPPPHFVGAR